MIFLDIDGVLNSAIYYKSVDRSKKGWSRFDPKSVAMVTKLLLKYSAKIVISSTWRYGALNLLSEELKKSGLKHYLHKDWKTPFIHPPNRGKEIKLWLDKHPEVTNYLILDDDINILDEMKLHFVKTEIYFGMKDEHFIKAKEILESNLNT